MKRALLALGLVLALVTTGYGDVARYKQVSATSTAQTVNLGGTPAIVIVNGGANEIYFRLFGPNENTEAAVATAAGGIYLASGASLEYGSGLFGSISIICDTAETATVHLYLK